MDNVEVVRAVLEAVERGDTKQVLALYAEDVEWDVSRGPLAPLSPARVFHNHDGLREFFRWWKEALDEPVYLVDEILEVGERVVTVGRIRGRGRVSGLDLEDAGQSAVWTVRRGRIARVVWFAGRDEAMAAVR